MICNKYIHKHRHLERMKFGGAQKDFGVQYVVLCVDRTQKLFLLHLIWEIGFLLFIYLN